MQAVRGKVSKLDCNGKEKYQYINASPCSVNCTVTCQASDSEGGLVDFIQHATVTACSWRLERRLSIQAEMDR